MERNINNELYIIYMKKNILFLFLLFNTIFCFDTIYYFNQSGFFFKTAVNAQNQLILNSSETNGYYTTQPINIVKSLNLSDFGYATNVTLTHFNNSGSFTITPFLTNLSYIGHNSTYQGLSTSSLVGYWRFENNSLDTSAYANNLTKINNPATRNESGIFGLTSYLNGASQYFQTINDIGIKGDDARTIAFWIYLNETPAISYHITDMGTSSNFKEAFGILVLTNRNIYIWIAGDDFSSGVNIPMNTWTHLAVVYDKSNLKIYKNGLLADYTAKSSLNTGNGKFYIGVNTYNFNEFFKGFIDEVTVFNRSLTDIEIRQLFINGLYTWEQVATSEFNSSIYMIKNVGKHIRYNITMTRTSSSNFVNISNIKTSFNEYGKSQIYNIKSSINILNKPQNISYTLWCSSDIKNTTFYYDNLTGTFEQMSITNINNQTYNVNQSINWGSFWGGLTKWFIEIQCADGTSQNSSIFSSMIAIEPLNFEAPEIKSGDDMYMMLGIIIGILMFITTWLFIKADKKEIIKRLVLFSLLIYLITTSLALIMTIFNHEEFNTINDILATFIAIFMYLHLFTFTIEFFIFVLSNFSLIYPPLKSLATSLEKASLVRI